MSWLNRIHVGDCREIMRRMIADGVRVQCVVTSPPYWGLRDYGVPGQYGLERTWIRHVARMRSAFRLVRELLADDGVLWLNYGDSYVVAPGGAQGRTGQRASRRFTARIGLRKRGVYLKAKDLVGMPWRIAFALQADGWYLRSDIIWCLSGGAWVYARTQKGDMPIMVKDLVRLNPRTVKLWNGSKWTQALGWWRSTNESERLELVLRSGERISCTGGHLWPTGRGNVPARELKPGDTILSCSLPEPDGAERPPYLTSDALWLAGLYLAEGSRSDDTIQLSLSADEAEWLPRIQAIAKHYAGSCTYTISGGSLHVRLYGAILRALIDTYIGGNTAIDKHLKVATWRLPNEALRWLAQGYLDGDGSRDAAAKGRWRLGFCRNYALERDLRTLAARLGATLTLKPATTKYQNGEAASFRGEWRWERSGHWNEKDRGEILEIRASRARCFWDIAVEDEPHLFALASGILTHNCKPNPMPESVRDRPTRAHDYLFLLAKSERYYYDAKAIAEPVTGNAHPRGHGRNPKAEPVSGWMTGPGSHDTVRHARQLTDARGPKDLQRVHQGLRDSTKFGRGAGWRSKQNESFSTAVVDVVPVRNARTVWTIASEPFPGTHFATFPRELVRRCILAGTRPGDVVFDPFVGSGTVAQVADELGRQWIGIELNPEYAAMYGTLRPAQLGVPLA